MVLWSGECTVLNRSSAPTNWISKEKWEKVWTFIFQSWLGSRSTSREALRKSWVHLPLDQWSKTTSHQNGRKINCNTANYVSFVVPGLSTSSSASSSPTSPTCSSQDAVITEYPHDDHEELHSDQLQGVPDWLPEFKHGLVNESVPEHRDASSSSHELPLEPRANVLSDKHSIFTHFLKD